MVTRQNPRQETCPVRRWATQAPHRIAIHSGEPLSYQRLDLRLNNLCNQLARAGLERGDHLAAVVRGALEDVLLAWALSLIHISEPTRPY